MDHVSIVLRGLLLGFSIAAPVGPIGVLCIRRTLADGRATGFATGMGAATADACYGAVAGLGLSFIMTVLIGQLFWIRLIGGLFLCYLGVRTALSRPAERAALASGSGLLRAYLSTLMLTFTNPMTILSFVAVFAGLGIGLSTGSYSSVALLIGGVFAGSALWWFLLSGGVSLLRRRVTPNMLVWVNRVSGGIILAFGIVALASLVRSA